MNDFVSSFYRVVRGLAGIAAGMQLALSPPFVLVVVLIGGTALISGGGLAPADLLPFLLLGLGLTAPVAALGHGFDDMRASVAENIALAVPRADLDDVVRVARLANIHDRILALPHGYQTVLGEEAELSGGEAQRISVARALLADAPVLVLDEATAFAPEHCQFVARTGGGDEEQ